MSKKVGDKSELLTKVEMDRLLDVVAGDLYFTTLYRCLRYSGRRIGEIYGTIRNKKLVGGIKVKDINFEEDQIIAYILKTKKTKNKVICPICNVRNIITNAFCSKCGNKLPNIDLESLKYSEPKKAIISIQPEYKDILSDQINTSYPSLGNDKSDLFVDTMMAKTRGLMGTIEEREKSILEEEAIKKEMEPEAKNRVTYRMILEKVAKEEKLEVTDKIANKEADKLAEKYKMPKR